MDKGFSISVLDNGSVTFVDKLGSDASIVEAARMSTGRGFVTWSPYSRCKKCEEVFQGTFDRKVCGLWSNAKGITNCDGTEFDHYPRGDAGILDYLYRNRHTSPFEMAELIIDIQVPMDCWRQWIRHRTANVNEYSTRYSEAIDVAARTAPDEWRTQGKTNRQGSGETLDQHNGKFLSDREDLFLKFAREIYEERLTLGVAKEQARKDLPLSTYTAARWKCDLHNIFHFLGLRLHPHAQKEIRAFANAVAQIVQELWPRSYALFEEYSLHGVHLSRTEAANVRKWVDEYLSEYPSGLSEATTKALLNKLGAA